MLSEKQRDQYSRHLMLECIGEEGQERLLGGRVLVIGAGGLGSPAALYLAAAGVGTIGIADPDDVELSNLQRQIIHSTSDVGKPKVSSAERRIRDLNPDVTVTPHHLRINAGNIREIIAGYDVVIDATDNFAAKFLINDACILAGKPYSHGGILRFDGQTMTVHPRKSACYRCIFPAPPPAEVATACSRDGVLGVLPGVIGTIQASEAIKYLAGIGDPLTDRLLTFNALRMKFREIPIKPDQHCPVCGTDPSIINLRDEPDPLASAPQ